MKASARKPPRARALRVTERPNPATEGIDALDTLGIVEAINAQDAKVAAAVRAQRKAIARAVDAIVGAFQAGGHLIYVGAGTSGRLGVLDAAECPPTFSTPSELVQGVIAGGWGALRHAVEGAEDDPEQAALELRERGLMREDVVVGIAASGSTPYVRGALEEAARAGATTVLVTCNPRAELASLAGIVIAPAVGPEVIAGSTRMKAGTATKLVLNTLTTAAMIRWGKVYGNRMVDVQPACAKLVERARRLVSELGGVDEAAAAELLRESNGRVKTAIVLARRGCGRREAEQLLARAGGRLRLALGEGPPRRPPSARARRSGERAARRRRSRTA